MNGFASGFLSGQQAAKQGIDMYRDSKMRSGMDAIASAQENTENTMGQSDADRIKAMAAETNEDGTPKYLMGFDGQSGYTATPTNGSNSDGTPTAATIINAMPKTTFLGKSYDGPISDQQKDSARTLAMAGVYQANGDPEKALSLRMQAQQMSQAEKQGKLTDLQISQSERQGKREDDADANTAAIKAVDADVAGWNTKRLTNPDGTQRDMTPDDMLAAGQYRVAKLVSAGKLTDANALAKDNLQMALTSIQAKTAQRTEAIGQTAAAVAQGDFSKLPDFYDKYVPDGAHVTNVSQDPKSGKVTIERQSVDGRTLAPKVFDNSQQVIAGLQMLNDPNALYTLSQNEFARQLHEKADKRADKALDLQAASTGATVAHMVASTGVLTEQLSEKKELDTIRKGLNAAIENGDDSAIKTGRAQLLTYMTGGKSGMNSMSPEERKANFYLASGKAKSMEDAASMAHEKVQASAKDDYMSLMKPNGNGFMPRAEDIEPVMAAMHGADWKTKLGGDTAPKSPAFATAADVDAAVKAGKVKKGDRVTVGGRTATWQ